MAQEFNTRNENSCRGNSSKVAGQCFERIHASRKGRQGRKEEKQGAWLRRSESSDKLLRDVFNQLIPLIQSFASLASLVRGIRQIGPGLVERLRRVVLRGLHDGCVLWFDSAMAKASLDEIVRYCDRILRTAEIEDYDGAVNGLQVENRGRVTRIAAAVDASLATVKLATRAGADLLVVHHGLFWAPSHPWTGKRYELLRTLLQNDLAVYSSHLPLDAHPSLGNNALLCAALGLKRLRPFFLSHGRHIGFQAQQRVRRQDLATAVKRATGVQPRLIFGGPEICRRIGVVTGGAGGELKIAAGEGVDTFITGEGPHWTYALAEELGINVIYGGHYATETFGVKALAAHLARKYKVPWSFLDHPSGL